MNETAAPGNWNVLTDKWLDVIDSDANACVFSPLEALGCANKVRCIAAGSPLDLFAAHRFLLALLYWKSGANGIGSLRVSLMKGGVPNALLEAITRSANKFRLFDNHQPFLQDSSVRDKGTKSAGSLFADFACGTNIAHFHHGNDEAMRLCLPCATVGMLRIVPWSQSGGAGLSPAVHNAPPIVALAIGKNLAVTLGLNLVELKGKAGKPKWSGHFKPTDTNNDIPFLEAFTWNPRRIQLGAPEMNGTCWRCGSEGVPVVGPIVYAKNEYTTQNKKGGKPVPFAWQDPSAFYKADKPYVTIKSNDEARAVDGRDLVGLTANDDAQPPSLVLNENLGHEAWRLIVPCTNPANNKTFDHRQVELGKLSAVAIQAIVPLDPPAWQQQGIDGWDDPYSAASVKGASAFVGSAARFLTHGDWVVLASAEFRAMHESPAAFDLLTGLLWPLRDKKVAGLPSRNVAWLTLKLMSVVPARARLPHEKAGFCPLSMLPKRQLKGRSAGRGASSGYPISFPRGARLEAVLRGAINHHVRQRTPTAIDWPGLCYRLDQLLD